MRKLQLACALLCALSGACSKQTSEPAAKPPQPAPADPNSAASWFELGKRHERERDLPAALAAFQKSIALDPRNPRAYFALGSVHGARNEHDQAAQMWRKTLELAPNHVDAHYNLGVHHQVRGEAGKSLEHFLAVHRLQPEDAEGVKKLVQAYYRLEQYRDAEAYRTKLLELVGRSPDPAVRGMKEFCFDQFDVKDGRFFAYETIDKKGDLVYWYRFKLERGGKFVKSINLETSSYAKERGVAFLLGQNVGRAHSTFDVAFPAMPPYPELRRLVLKAHAGELRVGASSTPK